MNLTYMTVQQVADLVGCTYHLVTAAIKNGRLKTISTGKVHKIDPVVAMEWKNFRDNSISPQEVAALAHCDVKTVYNAVKDGKLTATIVGKQKMVFNKDEALAWVASYVPPAERTSRSTKATKATFIEESSNEVLLELRKQTELLEALLNAFTSLERSFR